MAEPAQRCQGCQRDSLVLEQIGFKFNLLTDPTSQELKKALNDFVGKGDRQIMLTLPLSDGTYQVSFIAADTGGNYQLNGYSFTEYGTNTMIK